MGMDPVTSSLFESLADHAGMLEADQLRLHAIAKAFVASKSESAQVQELWELAGRMAVDISAIRSMVTAVQQRPSTELVRRLSDVAARRSSESGLGYTLKTDFSSFELDHDQMEGIALAIAAAVHSVAVTAGTAGTAGMAVIVVEGRKDSGLFRATITAESIVSLDDVDLDGIAQPFAALKGSVFVRPGNIQALVCEVPGSLRSMKGIVVRAGRENYALPVHSIVETMRLDPLHIQVIGGQEFLNFRSTSLPLVPLVSLLGDAGGYDSGHDSGRQNDAGSPRYALVVSVAGKRFGLVVDQLIQHRDLVLRNLGGSLAARPEIIGGAVDADGKIIMVLNPRYVDQSALKPAA